MKINWNTQRKISLKLIIMAVVALSTALLISNNHVLADWSGSTLFALANQAHPNQPKGEVLSATANSWQIYRDTADLDKLKFYYYPTTGQLTPAMTMATTGNVGIGTTNPLSELAIMQKTDNQGTTGGTGSGLRVYNSARTGNFSLVQGGDNASYLFNLGTGGMYFYVNAGTNAMFIGSNGNIGIGNIRANRSLDISTRSIDSSDGITIGQSSNNTQSIQTYIDGHWSDRSTYGGGTLNPLLLQPDSGYVGIGTNPPNGTLDIVTRSVDAADGMVLGQQANNTQSIQTYIDGHWSDRSTYAGGCCNVLSLQPDAGSVGIGTRTPGAKLDVAGNIIASVFVDKENPGYYADLAGNSQFNSIYYTGANQFNSDIRLKKNILPLVGALGKIEQLKGVSYEFNPDVDTSRSYPKGKQIGLIAQQVQPIVPEVVGTDPSGYLGIDYAKLTSLLIEGMKEQQSQIDQLKLEVEGLKQRLGK